MTIQYRFKEDSNPTQALVVPFPTPAHQDEIIPLCPLKAHDDSPQAVPLTEIDTLLASFSGYALDELDNANLMNRVDSKFILPLSFLPTLLQHIAGQYRVLDIQGKRVFSYYNQYLDTPDLALYRAHHNGKLNRYKVRRRHYLDTNTAFLEVKLKNNQSRTIKTRIKVDQQQTHSTVSDTFIAEQVHGNYSNLQITQQSGYNRIALANEAKAERLTLDFNLWYNTPSGDNLITLPGFFIAELKQSKKTKRSPFYQLMSQHHLFPSAFSKYCIGCALLYPSSLKTNRFKSVLKRIKQRNNTAPLF